MAQSQGAGGAFPAAVVAALVAICALGSPARTDHAGLPARDVEPARRPARTGSPGIGAGPIPLGPTAPVMARVRSSSAGLQDFGNIPYNGRFTFTRIRYGGPGFRRRGASSWSHDWPRADMHLPRILEFMTSMRPNVDGSNVLGLGDPLIFHYPIIYISEPGYWSISAEEAANLREYLLKGGFAILDDFENDEYYNMEAQLKRALPEYDLVRIGPEHPIFDAFFRIDNIYIPHPLVPVTPVYYGLFEGNDPTRRMLAIVNHNNDLAEYWEWSGSGWFPVDMTSEAYKIGVNYIVWAMAH